MHLTNPFFFLSLAIVDYLVTVGAGEVNECLRKGLERIKHKF